ncbi:hypothetical protein CK627_20830 [Aeromonas dhakensis]|uniref:hypothetical protein n=1 Tax=Aeromonas dhakensis TaxID=196024 RepID=UPI000BAAAC20|nr:hypothetical protein [Aeromonas dhakensis]ASX13054.1 hypothetical protein CK627_20830 [Aeromonas dhakensis]
MFDSLPIIAGSLDMTNCQITNVTGMQKNITQTGKVLTRATGTQRYEFEIDMFAIGERNAKRLEAFLASHVGVPFYISPPQLWSSSRNCTLGADLKVGANTMNVTGSILYGDYFTFMNSGKLYQATSSVLGSGNVDFTPKCRSTFKANEIISMKPLVLVTLLEGNTTYKSDVYWNVEYSFKVSEV